MYDYNIQGSLSSESGGDKGGKESPQELDTVKEVDESVEDSETGNQQPSDAVEDKSRLIIIMSGLARSGKSTQAEKMCKRYDLPLITIDSLLKVELHFPSVQVSPQKSWPEVSLTNGPWHLGINRD